MRQCWARSRGGCNRISKEHPFSNGLFSKGELKTHGFTKIPASVSDISRLSAKILCVAHNNELSILDSEAIKLAKILRTVSRSEQVDNHTVDGLLLTRWFYKAFVGLMASGWEQGLRLKPHSSMAEIIFGDRPFPQAYGVFLVYPGGSTDKHSEALSFRGLYLILPSEQIALGGMLVYLDGLTFLMWLGGFDTIEIIRQQVERVPELLGKSLVLRPTSITLGNEKVGSVCHVNFAWPTAYKTDIVFSMQDDA